MIAALVWKEYREQRIAWAALTVVGAAALFGLPVIMEPSGLQAESHARDMIAAAVVLVAWAYGLICGAMLLAGEREMGTLPFLDALPGLRGQVWRAKCLAGVLLVIAQVAVLMGLAAAASLFPNWSEAAATLIAMAGAALFGMAWGMLFSSFGRSVMNMILVGVAAQLAAVVLFVAPAAVLTALIAHFFGVAPEFIMDWSWAAVAAFSIPAALGASALVFTRLDRGRLRSSRQPARAGRAPRLWGRLFWLTWRQSRLFTAGLLAFSVLLGFLTLADGLLLWPAATLLVGVLCGATAFADEQQGPFRFLGDQRFPLGRFWIVKVGLRFLIAVVAAFVVFLPSAVAALGKSDIEGYGSSGVAEHVPFLVVAFQSGLLATVCPSGLFLTAWLVSGFCAGVLCGLLFRNGLASGVFSLFLGSLLVVVWLSSMLQGGLHAWQMLGPPALLLLSTPLLLRPWAAGRVVSWTTTRRLAPFAVLAVLWVAGGLYYRIVEIPDAPPPGDLAAFRASLPPPENKAGELIRSACGRFDVQRRPAAGEAPGGKPTPEGRIDDVVEHGWTRDDPELTAWLDRLFAGDWVQSLREAADLPPGMVVDLRLETIDSPDRVLNPARRIAVALVARGLQRQAAGDDDACVENLRLGLALSRSLRRRQPDLEVIVGRSVEGILLVGLNHWLERLDGRPDLLRRALGLLSDYLDTEDDDEADQRLVNYLIARNSMDEPLSWLPYYLSNGTNGAAKAADVEAQMVGLSGLLVPWERQRQERILRFLFSSRPLNWPEAVRDSPLATLSSLAQSPRAVEPKQRFREQAMRIALALRWYEAENGRPADKLDDLVPKYLLTIPDDPFQKGQPLHYRVSKGEKIVWPPNVAGGPPQPIPPGGPPQAPAAPGGPPQGPAAPGGPPTAPGGPPPPPPSVDVAPGQGVLWSVGPDGHDDGGVRQANAEGYAAPGEDVIFLVPLPPKGK